MKNCYNVRNVTNGKEMYVDLDQVEWRRMRLPPEEVNIVMIPRSQHNDPRCIQAKLDELQKLEDFQTYSEIEDRGQNTISTTWVLWQKGEEFRARLVARGFEDEAITENDSPTVAKSTLRVFLTYAAHLNWKIRTTDIKSAFLQGKILERDVFLKPPPEAEVSDGKIWKLRRCLYGLNDAARQFYESVVESLLSLGCQRSNLDPALFYRRGPDGVLIGLIACHIDDFLHAGNKTFDDSVMTKLRQRFLAGKLEEGQFKYIGFEIKQSVEGVTLNQDDFTRSLEIPEAPKSRKKEDPLVGAEFSSLRSQVGRLNWAVQGSRPDMAFDMIELSTRFRKGTVEDLVRAGKCLRRLKDSTSTIYFPSLGDVRKWRIIVFSDAAHANLNDGVSSTGGHLVLLCDPNGNCCILSWQANKIKRVVKSSLAAETLSLLEGIEDAFFLHSLMSEIGILDADIPISSVVDSKSLVENVHSTKSVEDKRTRIDLAAIKEYLMDGRVKSIQWCPGSKQLANCMTKKGASGVELLEMVQKGKIDLSEFNLVPQP